MKRSIGTAVFVVAALVAAITVAGTPAGARLEDDPSSIGKGASDVYLVLLDDPPAAAYQGGVAGYAPTRPAPGKRLNKNDANVRRYVAYLQSRHADVANRIGATPMYDYTYSLDGFAAPLTRSQVSALRQMEEVVSIERDSLSHTQTDNTPEFLGLTESGGVWSQLGGQASAGEDVIIGVIDTGIWPEHPSFAPAGYGPPPTGWSGTCQAGQLWSKQTCNNKLIGARFFDKGMSHFGGQLAGEYQSPRDHDGHGTHTASTAGGNANVAAKVFERDFGTISGMAPRARIAAYKACWELGCANSDLVAAIDLAVADGVDVINYSIGDGDPDFLDSDDVSFLFARQAGVFVAASAGNSGPDASTVDHGGPWLTTVGASTQNRSFVGTATLDGGATFSGVSITPGLASTALVDGADAGNAGCLTDLDPAMVTGKVVLCDGSYSRAARGLAVKQAGGVGMILYTAAEFDALMSDNHHIPALHVQRSAGLQIREYIATAGADAAVALSGGSKQLGGGNTMAAFSSRGPLLPSARSTGDLLKPDVTAPGVQVLAGNTPTATVGAPGQLFQAIGGTSMSSPHVAGLGALLRDLHPDWTPDMMQSALMTSARQDIAKQDGTTPADPFDFGAGHVRPNGAADPGLVYPASFDDYRAFLRSQGLCTVCFGSGPAPEVAATNLNVPSITVRALAGTRTVMRTVKNVGPEATYTVTVDAPNGVTVDVVPTSLTLAAGATASYEVRFSTANGATFDEYAFGAITWGDGGGHIVRVPLAIRPVVIAAPATIDGTGTNGSAVSTVQFGYTGPFATGAQGLVPATTETRTIADDPSNQFDTSAPEENQGVQVHSLAVPAGTTFLRTQLFDDLTDGDDDLDLYLYRVGGGGSLTLVGESAGGTSAERIDLDAPAAGDYTLYVHGWQTDGRSAVYTLSSWIVPSTSSGNMTSAAPPTATPGDTAAVTLEWTGLIAGTRYLGRLTYSDGATEIGSTLVSVRA